VLVVQQLGPPHHVVILGDRWPRMTLLAGLLPELQRSKEPEGKPHVIGDLGGNDVV